jgi:hypothetical protein
MRGASKSQVGMCLCLRGFARRPQKKKETNPSDRRSMHARTRAACLSRTLLFARSSVWSSGCSRGKSPSSDAIELLARSCLCMCTFVCMCMCACLVCALNNERKNKNAHVDGSPRYQVREDREKRQVRDGLNAVAAQVQPRQVLART